MTRPPFKTYRVVDPATGETMALVYGDVVEQLRPAFEAQGLEVLDGRNGETTTGGASDRAPQ